MSLKKFLNNQIKTNGWIDYSELEVICKEHPAKVGVGERKMRELVAEKVCKPVYEKNYIKKWVLLSEPEQLNLL